MLEELFLQLAGKTTSDKDLCMELWQEIGDQYGAAPRQYHTLTHLEHLVQELQSCNDLIQQKDALLFSVFYHDIVYDVSGNDNEERSAVFALQRMDRLGVAQPVKAQCSRLILATKNHTATDDPDTGLFTDADLSILGSTPEKYKAYARHIRMEYALYPDSLYLPGRKKVLQHFLAMPRIYKTDYFFQRFETQARLNMQEELDTLL